MSQYKHPNKEFTPKQQRRPLLTKLQKYLVQTEKILRIDPYPRIIERDINY